MYPEAVYQATRVAGASPAGLVLLLYDRMINCVEEARMALREARTEAARLPLGRAQRIAGELLATLDPEAGELAANLKRLYLFVIVRLGEARVTGDDAKLASVETVLRELRTGWVGIQNGGHEGERLPGQSGKQELVSQPEEAVTGGAGSRYR